MPLRRSLRVHRLFMLLAAACAASSTTAGTLEDIDNAVDAIWRVRSVTLHFNSPTTYYYCDILQQRVSDILRTVGAGDPMSVQAKCSVGSLINDTSVQIVAGLPVEASPENVTAETTFDTRTELVAQTRNWKLPTPTSVRRFRAVRTELSFAQVDLHLSPNDCDLLQAMSQQVFPTFNIRTLTPLSCTMGSQPVARPGMVVDALLPLTALPVARR